VITALMSSWLPVAGTMTLRQQRLLPAGIEVNIGAAVIFRRGVVGRMQRDGGSWASNNKFSYGAIRALPRTSAELAARHRWCGAHDFRRAEPREIYL
jgi:hypothetical protein